MRTSIADASRLESAVRRTMARQRQMQERSGPEYELAVEHSRVINAAWRAFGSPRRVSRVHAADGLAYRFTGRGGRWGSEPATLDDWNAWQGWQRERARLRAQVRAGSPTKAAEAGDGADLTSKGTEPARAVEVRSPQLSPR